MLEKAMMARIHLVVSEQEKERYRRAASREGKTLSDWIRAAAHARLETAEESKRIDTSGDLARFFAECDGRESGKEPDWSEHRRVIERSFRSGRSDS